MYNDLIVVVLNAALLGELKAFPITFKEKTRGRKATLGCFKVSTHASII
jgi:hypothetical protein